MEIKVRVQNGETVACLFNPATNQVVEEKTISEGEEVCFTAVTAHAESDIEVGEITQVASTETECAPDANPDREENASPADEPVNVADETATDGSTEGTTDGEAGEPEEQV